MDYKYLPRLDTPPTVFRSNETKMNDKLSAEWKGILDTYIGFGDDPYSEFMNQAVVVENDKLMFSWVNGMKDTVNRQKADEDTRMGLGSFTKSFTGALVEKFIDMNYITSRDDLVTAYLNPKYSFPENGITIEQLLTHTSRLNDLPFDKDAVNPADGADRWGFSYFKQYSQNGEIRVNAQDMRLDFVSQFKDLTFPGSRDGDVIDVGEFSYSNAGYIMLGLICEEAYFNETDDTKLIEFLYKTYIFDEAEMNRASSGWTSGYIERTDRTVNEASSYTSYDAGPVWGFNIYATTPVHPLGVFSAGNIITSAKDAAKFLPALSKGTLMSSAATEEYFNGRVDSTAHFLNWGSIGDGDPNTGSQYGSGIMEFQFNATVDGVVGQPTGKTLYFHGGLRDGFVTSALYDRELDISIVTTYNIDWTFQMANVAVKDLYKRYVEIYHPASVTWDVGS